MIRDIPYVALDRQWQSEKIELLQIFEEVLSSGQLVSGHWVEEFERKVAMYCNTKYAVALNSGTDALVCALHALGIRRGDEVITPPNSFIASTAAIVHLGAVPVFADVDEDQMISVEEVEKKITSNTKAIMPVHLTGRMARMAEINDLAERYKLFVIEDAAQAIGSRYEDKSAGHYGDVGCFSTHPLKNLNAAGDGGFITTDCENIYKKIRIMRTHGIINRDTVNDFGFVSRMDSLQAAILSYRLDKISDVIDQRRRLANLYEEHLNPQFVYFPIETSKYFNTYHTFVIQVDRRDELKEFLMSKGVGTAIHYPTPIHKQPAYAKFSQFPEIYENVEKQSERILSLPIHQYLDENDVKYIATMTNEFYER